MLFLALQHGVRSVEMMRDKVHSPLAEWQPPGDAPPPTGPTEVPEPPTEQPTPRPEEVPENEPLEVPESERIPVR